MSEWTCRRCSHVNVPATKRSYAESLVRTQTQVPNSGGTQEAAVAEHHWRCNPGHGLAHLASCRSTFSSRTMCRKCQAPAPITIPSKTVQRAGAYSAKQKQVTFAELVEREASFIAVASTFDGGYAELWSTCKRRHLEAVGQKGLGNQLYQQQAGKPSTTPKWLVLANSTARKTVHRCATCVEKECEGLLDPARRNSAESLVRTQTQVPNSGGTQEAAVHYLGPPRLKKSSPPQL